MFRVISYQKGLSRAFRCRGQRARTIFYTRKPFRFVAGSFSALARRYCARSRRTRSARPRSAGTGTGCHSPHLHSRPQYLPRAFVSGRFSWAESSEGALGSYPRRLASRVLFTNGSSASWTEQLPEPSLGPSSLHTAPSCLDCSVSLAGHYAD